MFRYTVKRILLAVLTCAIILTLTFFLMKLQPFPKFIASQQSQMIAYYDEQVRLGYLVKVTGEDASMGTWIWKYSEETGLGSEYFYYVRPIFDQFLSWVRAIFLEGKWGTSVSIEKNVDAMTIILKGAGGDFLKSRMWTTIKINVWPVLISVPTGIALGIWAALKKNTMTDHIISTLVMVFISIPSFIILTLLIQWLAFDTGWLPSSWPTAKDSSLRQFQGYIIPTISLSFGSICGYCRAVRAELTEVMSSDFLLLARTKGLTRNQAIIRHALKNAFVPILPSVLAEIIGLLGGSMILETIYAIPGVGRLYYQAITSNDYNVLMADMALYTIIGLLSGVFLDLSYGFIDPRIRMGAAK